VLEVSGISIAPLELGVVERQRSTTSKGSAPGTFVRSTGSFIKHLGRTVMNNEPKRQEPEIMPPVPKGEPERLVPEIPPDKDAPERKTPIRGEN
jgi:hypothetical protein